MSDNAELVAVLAAGLSIFVALMRYVTVYTKSADKRRLEILAMYEDVIIENAKLKGAAEVSKIQMQSYKSQIVKYKVLYEKTLDITTNIK